MGIFEITLLVERAGFDHRPGWHPEAIPGIRTVVAGSLVSGRGDGLRSLPFALSWHVLRERPDVVLFCNATQILLALPSRAVMRPRTAVLVEDIPRFVDPLPAWRRRLKAGLYRRCDLVLPLSDEAAAYARTVVPADRIRPASWSIDCARFRPGRREGPPRVIFVGRLVAGKGVITLIEAWQLLRRNHGMACELVLVGDGPKRPEIEARILAAGLDGVRLAGHLDRDGVARELSRAHLLVLPTFRDLFSMAVLEAMAAGCAIVTTRFAGSAGLVARSGAGWLAEPDDPASLAQLLARILGDADELDRRGRAARRAALAFDDRPVMERLAGHLLEAGP
jgi:glycosyltransferase involved in cell wall biosynthesis